MNKKLYLPYFSLGNFYKTGATYSTFPIYSVKISSNKFVQETFQSAQKK